MQIYEADLQKVDDGIEVSFIALFPSSGWTDVGLSVPQYFVEPYDGIQDVSIVATPPFGNAFAVAMPMPLMEVLPGSDWLLGVRIRDTADQPILTLRTAVMGKNAVGSDMVAVKNAALLGDKILMDVVYGGGLDCGPHRFQLNWDGKIRKSNPPQVWLELSYDGSKDPCKGIVSERLQFDLSPIISDPGQYVIVVQSETTELVAHNPK